MAVACMWLAGLVLFASSSAFLLWKRRKHRWAAARRIWVAKHVTNTVQTQVQQTQSQKV